MTFHPALPFLLVALLTLARGRSPLTRMLHMLLPVLAFLCLYPYLPTEGAREVHRVSFTFAGKSWGLLHVDTLSILFAGVFLIYTFLANLYSFQLKNRILLVGTHLYAGASLGAVLAGDLLVLFIFWELMALASALLVWNPDKPASLKAVLRYLMVHAAGGLLFFAGLMLRITQNESLALTAQSLDLAGCLIFAAFAVNAALPPIHSWLPDAYSSSTPEGGVYLCTFTSKVAVFAFARCFMGSEWLIYLGAFAAVLGVIYALMEDDTRKLLSYHIICQVGYMLVGIGLGSEMGMNAGVGHAVGNILFKGLLFMAAGCMIQMTGFSRLSDLGGLASKNKSLLVLYLVGALAISGLPGLNGYVTKSLLVSAASKAHLGWLELVLMLVAVGTFLSIALKLAYFAFFHKPPAKLPSQKIPVNMLTAMGGAAILCLVSGLMPETFLYPFLPYKVKYQVFTPGHILETLQLLAGGFAAFLWMKNKLHAHATLSLDLDWFYRKGAGLFVQGFCVPVRIAQEVIQAGLSQTLKEWYAKLNRLIPSRSMPATSYSLLWILAAFMSSGILLFLIQK